MKRKRVERYEYVAANGALRGRVDRIEPGLDGKQKSFVQYRFDAEKKCFLKGLNGAKLPLYHGDLIARAVRDGRIIFSTEGERKADRLRGAFEAGGVAAEVTTIAGGANESLTAEHLADLHTASCITVLVDSDDAGRDAGQIRASALAVDNRERPVKMIDLYPHAVAGGEDYKKDVADWLAEGHNVAELLALVNDAEPVVAPDEPQLNTVLDQIKTFILRFAVLAKSEAAVYLALWVFHTHAIEAADYTPFTIITSPQKRSGKSRLEEVLKCLVARPWMTSRTTVAALIRKVAKDRCTFLLDETDAAFAGDKDYAQALRAVLDAMHTRGATATLCVGQGANMEARDFEVFAAVAIAGIGRLPDTVEDRGVRIGMKRKTKAKQIERFRPRKIKGDADALCARIENGAKVHLDALKIAQPELPDELNERAQDGWEPLLAIADAAGGDWPTMARRAAVALSGDRADDDDQNPSGWLLRDIQRAFDATPNDTEGAPLWVPPWEDAARLHSAELIDRLCRVPGSLWATWRRGEAITARSIAKLLDGYTDANGKPIRSRQIKIDGVNRHGYERADFEDAFSRFLTPVGERNATDATGHMADDNFANFQNATDDPGSGLNTDESYRQDKESSGCSVSFRSIRESATENVNLIEGQGGGSTSDFGEIGRAFLRRLLGTPEPGDDDLIERAERNAPATEDRRSAEPCGFFTGDQVREKTCQRCGVDWTAHLYG